MIQFKIVESSTRPIEATLISSFHIFDSKVSLRHTIAAALRRRRSFLTFGVWLMAAVEEAGLGCGRGGRRCRTSAAQPLTTWQQEQKTT